MGGRLTPELRDALAAFRQASFRSPFMAFPKGKNRDALRKLGLIERWNPIAKVTGRIKPWRVTPAGRAALEEAEGG